MNKLKIVVACGSGIATSTLAVEEVKSVLDEFGIKSYDISKTSMQELKSASIGADIVLTTNNYKGDLDVEVMSVSGFITGINEAKLRKNLGERILEIQKNK